MDYFAFTIYNLLSPFSNIVSNENLKQYSLNLSSIYISLIAMFGVFWILGLFLSREKAVSRPISKTTHTKVVLNLARNTLIVFAWAPINALVPVIFPVYDWLNIFPGCPISNIAASIIKYFCVILFTDAWFYYAHRLMHHPYFYKYHRQHHEFIQPYALAGLYCGAFEMWFCNNLSASLPMRLFGLGGIEMLLLSVLTSLFVIKGHGGIQYLYNGSDSLIADWEHAHHHKKMNVNYGTSYFFDRLHGTYDGFMGENIDKTM